MVNRLQISGPVDLYRGAQTLFAEYPGPERPVADPLLHPDQRIAGVGAAHQPPALFPAPMDGVCSDGIGTDTRRNGWGGSGIFAGFWENNSEGISGYSAGRLAIFDLLFYVAGWGGVALGIAPPGHATHRA